MNAKYFDPNCKDATCPDCFPSWSVVVDGAVVYTGGYGRAKREADKRGGTLRPSETMIRVSV